MTLLLAAFVVVTFAVTIERLRLPARVYEVGTRAKSCLRTLRDSSLDDGIKEQELQRQSVHLFGLLGILAGGSAAAILLPLVGVWLLDQAGVASLSAVLSVLGRLDFLAGATILGTVAHLVVRKFGRR